LRETPDNTHADATGRDTYSKPDRHGHRHRYANSDGYCDS
jgi:hypothetical protein